MSSKWQGINSSELDSALAKKLQKLKESTDSFFEVTIAGLTLVQEGLRFALTLLSVVELPIITLLNELIQELEQIKRDLSKAGFYLTYDKEIHRLLEDPYLLRGGYQAFEQRIIKKLTNPTDLTRPEFSRSSKVTAILFHAGGPVTAIADIIKSILEFIKTLTGGSTEVKSLPVPVNVSTAFIRQDEESNLVSELSSDEIDKDNLPSGVRVKWEISGRQNAKSAFPSFVIPPPYFWVIVSARPKPLVGYKRQRIKDFIDDNERGEVIASPLRIGDSNLLINSDLAPLVAPELEGGKALNSYKVDKSKGSKVYRFEQANPFLSLTLEQTLEESKAFLVESSTLGAFFGKNTYDLDIFLKDMPKGFYQRTGDSYLNYTFKESKDIYISVVSANSELPPFQVQDYKEIFGKVKLNSLISTPSERVKFFSPKFNTDKITYLEVLRDALTLFCLARYDLSEPPALPETVATEAPDTTQTFRGSGSGFFGNAFSYASSTYQKTTGEATEELSSVIVERTGGLPFVLDPLQVADIRAKYEQIKDRVSNYKDFSQAFLNKDNDLNKELFGGRNYFDDYVVPANDPFTKYFYEIFALKGALRGVKSFEVLIGNNEESTSNRTTDYAHGNPLAQNTIDNILSSMTLTGNTDDLLDFFDKGNDNIEINGRIRSLVISSLKRVFAYGIPSDRELDSLKDDIEKITKASVENSYGIGFFNLLERKTLDNPISSSGFYKKLRDEVTIEINKVVDLGDKYTARGQGDDFSFHANNTIYPIDRPVLLESSVLASLIEAENSAREIKIERDIKSYSDILDEEGSVLYNLINLEGPPDDDYDRKVLDAERSEKETLERARAQDIGYLEGYSSLVYPEVISGEVPSARYIGTMYPEYVEGFKDFRSIIKEADIEGPLQRVLEATFKGRVEIKGEWQFYRLFENGIPEVDLVLDALIKYVKSVRDSFKSIVDTLRKYINTLNKRILEIQRLILLLKKIIDSILGFKFNMSADFLFIPSADGTQGLVSEIKQSRDKPPVTDTSVGGAFVAGGLPSILIDLFTAALNPSETADKINKSLNDAYEGAVVDPLQRGGN